MVGIKMEDSNNWEAKYVNCKYADRLVNKLVELNQQVTIPVNMNEVKKGIYYAKKYHGSQMRQSGDPYYSHPIEVAYMVSVHLYRTDIIVTSILHDTIEDTKLTRSMIASVFGEHIASQVEDLSRNKPRGKISSAETLNILFQQKKYDVLLIKLFDRLHNLQTIGAKSSEKARKTIVETLSRFMSLSMYYNTPTIEQNFAELCSKVIHTYYKTNN